MALKKLRVLARGTALVLDYEAMEAGMRRYIGRTLDTSTLGEETGVAFQATHQVHEVPATHEYEKHVRHGDLWAGDEATAKHCGVPFDPFFGEPEKAPESDEKTTSVSADAPKEAH